MPMGMRLRLMLLLLGQEVMVVSSFDVVIMCFVLMLFFLCCVR